MRYRLSPRARLDVATIRDASRSSFGDDAWLRYRGLLAASMRRAAAHPEGRATIDRSAVAAGLRSLHIRHARAESRAAPAGAPVHVLFYRAVAPGLIEIVRALHERMEPSQHLLSRTLDDRD